MPTVKVNGIEVEVPPGTNMVEAAKKAGVDIPHYCFHPHLPIAGNCRMCVVDVEAGGRGPDIACNMTARDGLAIRTDTDRVKRMRKSVMEFLLANHPLDCPICDQSGECRLQDYYMDHGQYESRLADAKVNKTKRQDIGDLIVLDGERCIACSRCVRFGDEVTKTGELRLFNRTDHTEIGLFPGTRLGHHYQGCLADICPVGALTNKDFRFEKRVWYLKESPSVCDQCGTGCNIVVCHQQGEVFRFLPRRNDEVNKSWMCDFGRLSYKRLNHPERILRARLQGRPAEVDEAAGQIAAGMAAAAAQHGEAAVAAVLGSKATNEANWALVRAMRENLPGARLFTCAGNDPDAFEYSDDILVDVDKNPNTTGMVLLAQFDGEVGDRDALVRALTDRSIRYLLVLEDDVVGRLGDLPKLDGLAYVGGWPNATARRADAVLPAASHVEQEGSFTNVKGRVQRLRMAYPPKGDSRPAYALLDVLGGHLGKAPHTATASAVFRDMAMAVMAYHGMSLARLGEGGVVVHDPDLAPAPAASTEQQPQT